MASAQNRKVWPPTLCYKVGTNTGGVNNLVLKQFVIIIFTIDRNL